MDPRRFTATNITAYNLLTWAYSSWTFRSGGNCLGAMVSNLFSGEPAWTRSELFDIQALIPAGSPSYTKTQLRNGEAPELQTMLQTLLTDRFKLVLRRELKEMPVYVLTVDKGGPKFVTQIDLSKRLISGSSDEALYLDWVEMPAETCLRA